MKKTFLIILLLAVQVRALDSLTQFGITWTFQYDINDTNDAGLYQYGTFANGDYWVVANAGDANDPNVFITSIDPNSFNVAGRIKNGSMINPDPNTNNQGYDNEMNFAPYVAGLNVAFEVNSVDTLAVEPNTSLISTISVATGGVQPQLKTAAILTVLPSAPDANSFRPPYCGADKSIQFNVSDLDYSKLGSLTALDSVLTLTKEVLDDSNDQDETVERMFQRPWIDHMPNTSWAQLMHPDDNMEHYGFTILKQVSWGALMLQLDLPDANKATLLISFVQVGLDFYGIIQADVVRNWTARGGHSSGRKVPILFASLVLNDANMQAIFAKTGDYLYEGEYEAGNPPPDMIRFSEDDQTFYVKAADIYTSPYDLNYNFGGQNSGTVAVVNGSAIVTGTDTGWSDPSAARKFAVVGGAAAVAGVGGYDYAVDSWDSATQVTLDTPFLGDTDSGVSYRFSDRIWFGHGQMGNLKDYEEYTNTHLGLPEFGITHAADPETAGLDWDANYRTGKSDGGSVLAMLIMDGKTLWNHDVWFDYEDRYVAIEKVENPTTWFYSDFEEDMWDEYRTDYGAVWSADTDPPTPNPATFATAPAAVNTVSITMTATTASDAGGSTPVAYSFVETTGNDGATNSGWQAGATYVDSGLTANTQYTYTVQTRDAVPNTGTASSGSSATTESVTFIRKVMHYLFHH